MTKILTIIIFISFIPKSFACMCTVFWNEWNEQQTIETIEFSDVIFIGELKALADDCYEFEIIKVFNGNLEKGNVVAGNYVTSCSAMPYGNGKYIIYGQYHTINEEIIFDYSLCSPSRKISDIRAEKESEYLKKELNLLNEYFDKKL
jgi:hypothetical protein